ncbi:hypothetical protein VaNZ11_001996 [Volvox africanus]|uniref:Tbc2 translation factor, chloroplastic n=1 Tax=Volvox africanus TaxID=51714 RepID=A0ABQ5RRR7_9CHLO|nr:hypothetical protein VaNZ11_001996 [Volvox africanus]
MESRLNSHSTAGTSGLTRSGVVLHRMDTRVVLRPRHCPGWTRELIFRAVAKMVPRASARFSGEAPPRADGRRRFTRLSRSRISCSSSSSFPSLFEPHTPDQWTPATAAAATAALPIWSMAMVDNGCTAAAAHDGESAGVQRAPPPLPPQTAVHVIDLGEGFRLSLAVAPGYATAASAGHTVALMHNASSLTRGGIAQQAACTATGTAATSTMLTGLGLRPGSVAVMEPYTCSGLTHGSAPVVVGREDGGSAWGPEETDSDWYRRAGCDGVNALAVAKQPVAGHDAGELPASTSVTADDDGAPTGTMGRPMAAELLGTEDGTVTDKTGGMVTAATAVEREQEYPASAGAAVAVAADMGNGWGPKPNFDVNLVNSGQVVRTSLANSVNDADEGLAARKALTRCLRQAASWRQLRELLAANGPSLDELHVLVAARRLRDVAPQPGRRVAREQARFRSFLSGFTELCWHFLPDMGLSSLAGVLYALAALRWPPPDPWMTSWLLVSEHRLKEFGPRELANITYALAQLGYDPGTQWLTALCNAAATHLPTATQTDPAAGGGAADAGGSSKDGKWDASANVPHAEQTGASSDGDGAAAAADVRFTAHGLSQLLWGLARLGHTPQEPTMQALCTDVQRQLQHFTPSGLSNSLWGVTVMSYKPPDSWVADVAASSLQLMPSCSSYDLSIITWALLRLGFVPNRDWLAGFLSASFCQLPSASPEHAARILWGLAKVGLTPPTDWMRHWLSMAYVRLLEADPTSLTTMMWALAKLGVRPSRKWVELLLISAWEQPLRAFSPPDLVMLLWGLARCGSTPEEAWMEEFWSVSYKRLPVLPARHLALLVHSCVALGQAPGARWLAGHETVTAARMYEQTAEGLSLLSYSYGMLERTPSREWFQALYAAAVRSGFDDFDAMGLERLIWGIAKMNAPADAFSADWIDAFLARCAAQMHELSYCNFANVLFALALLGVKPGCMWLAAAAARGEALMDDFGQTTAAKVLWALPRLATSPGNDDGGGEQERQALARLERLLEARMRKMVVRRLRQVQGVERQGRSTVASGG